MTGISDFRIRAEDRFPYRFIFDASTITDEAFRALVDRIKARFGPDGMPFADSPPGGDWTYYSRDGTEFFHFLFMNEMDAIECRLMCG